MGPIVTDRVHGLLICLSVGMLVKLSVTLVSLAKTAEPIELLFKLLNGVQGTMY